MDTKKKSALKAKSGVKGGRLAQNHSARSLKVKSRIQAGRLSSNHSARLR